MAPGLGQSVDISHCNTVWTQPFHGLTVDTDRLLDQYIIQRNTRYRRSRTSTLPMRQLCHASRCPATTQHRQHSTMALKSVVSLSSMFTHYQGLSRSKPSIQNPELRWTSRSQTVPGPSPTNWLTHSVSRRSMSQTRETSSRSLSRVVCVGSVYDCSVPRAPSRSAV